MRRFYFLVLLGSFLLWGCSSLPSAAEQSSRPAAANATATPRNTRVRKPSATPQATRRSRSTPSPRATQQRRATATLQSTPAATQQIAQPQAQPIAGFKVITPDELPPEGRDTLALIEQGGPFPYRQDGVVFQNRERLLPRKPSGYYHEYTVKTPGEGDRGARRIITGEGGELFYTADHYDSFVQVVLE